MTMEFWLREISGGPRQRRDRVDFTIVEETHGEYITEIKKARP